MAKTKLNKQNHPTKEQLLELQKQQAEVNRKRRKVSSELYPLLKEQATSVEDAKMLCQILTAGLRQAFGNLMREKTVKDVDLLSKLNPKDPRHEFFGKLIAMFEDESMTAALEMLEGFPQMIDGCIRQEMSGRPLSELKVEFLPEAPKV